MRWPRSAAPVAYDLAGRVALITGGNGGIGAATTAALIRRGARVGVVDLSADTPKTVAQRHGEAAFGYVGDVRDRASLRGAVDATVDHFGKLDIVIANAGLLAKAGTLRVTPPEAFETTMAVNVLGVVNTVDTALEQVIANRGQVVLISSVFAFLNGIGAIPYAMSKAAVEQLGRALRLELADHGVSVLTAYFSLVDTDMVKRGVDADAAVMDLLRTLPKAVLKRVSAESAASVIAEGLEHRTPRVMHPRRWVAVSALRGIAGPALDDRLSHDRRTLDVLARLDRR